MNVEQIIQQCQYESRRWGGMDNIDDVGGLTNEQMHVGWINEAVMELCLRTPINETWQDIHTTPNEPTYKIPTNWLLPIMDVWYDDRRLDYMHPRKWDYVPTTTGSTLEAFTMRDGRTITWGPTPDLDLTVLIHVRRSPKEISEVSSTPDLPLQFHHGLKHYVLMKMAEMEALFNISPQHRAKWLDFIYLVSNASRPPQSQEADRIIPDIPPISAND